MKNGKTNTRAYFHGTDQELTILKKGSCVAKREIDAQKFGYRRAVANKSPSVYIYTVSVPTKTLIPDPKRNCAFILTEDAPASLRSTFDKWSTPAKLKKFTLAD